MQNSLSDRLAQCYSGAVYDVLRERGMTDTILPHAIKAVSYTHLTLPTTPYV